MQEIITFVENDLKKALLITKYLKYGLVRDHCHYTRKYTVAAHNICNIKFNVLSEIHVAFHNDSDDDYRFIIKELENKFYEKFEYLGENRVKYKTFSVPIETEVLSAPGLAWEAALKKTEVKFELLTDINMSLMVAKCIRGGICHSIH